MNRVGDNSIALSGDDVDFATFWVTLPGGSRQGGLPFVLALQLCSTVSRRTDSSLQWRLYPILPRQDWSSPSELATFNLIWFPLIRELARLS